ncbi:glycosyltransferase family 4 protein [Rugosimonospora africana]|uniref:Glycosyltransferase subfamily 4-like N-terminal domain-containing protein n=1 Tax=Rugosimonospora africana TaxID=556532 RepID=A0A8J3QJ53_9ACTN|nr:glycosyltransferase family 4 protein [Rugosimonospora africana]GIH11865.1 hypothetical protein Raf01_00370 [Rugosimonospora africana]
MRLLFVCKTYRPLLGGVERHVASLAEELAGRHEVTVLAMRTAPRRDSPLDGNLWPSPRFAPFVAGGVAVEQLVARPRLPVRYLPFAVRTVPGLRRLCYGRGRLALAAIWVPALIRAIEPHAARAELVHVFADEFLALAGVLAARRAGRPVAVNGFVHPRAWGDDLVSQRAYQTADVAVANRAEDAAHYRALGVPADRVHIGGEGIPAPLPPRVPAHPGYRPDERYVVFLGRRQAYKGFDLMVDAAARLAATRSGVRVAFIGPGPRLPEDAPGALDLGVVTDDERDAWLSRAEVLCLPSAHETYGLCLLEAWAHRVPVVVSDIPVLANLMRESGGGLATARDSAAIADTVGGLLDDPALRGRLGEAGHAFWRAEASTAAYAERHLTIYRGLSVAPVDPEVEVHRTAEAAHGVHGTGVHVVD